MPAITIPAPAKINLSLHVCGKRADGYHLLDSLVVFAGVGDVITVAPADTLTLAITGPFGAALSTESDNLVLRAARLLAETHKITAGATITLEKNLPVASGIGGGSADAAATLKACAKLWGVKLKGLSNQTIATKLGADVPVCLKGLPAFMSGIGEIVAPAPALPEAWLVLANPGVPLATRTVFEALRGRSSEPMERGRFAGLTSVWALSQALGLTRNDLTLPATKLQPVIGTVIKGLQGTGAMIARMCGSGPTCFGLFAEEAAAQRAAKSLATLNPGWWTAAAPILKG